MAKHVSSTCDVALDHLTYICKNVTKFLNLGPLELGEANELRQGDWILPPSRFQLPRVLKSFRQGIEETACLLALVDIGWLTCLDVLRFVRSAASHTVLWVTHVHVLYA